MDVMANLAGTGHADLLYRKRFLEYHLVALGGIGLRIAPGTSAWWLTRPVWILVLGSILLLITPIFVRYEQVRVASDAVSPPLWRSLIGAIFFCVGMALLTLKGITADYGFGIRIVELSLPFIGAIIAKLDILPFIKSRR